MSLQAAIEHALPQLRAEAEARMTSTCTIRRKGAQTTSDGFEGQGWTDVHVGIPVEIQDGGERRIDVAGVAYVMGTNTLALPWDTLDLADGDFVEILDGDWAGTVYRILEPRKKSTRKSRRVPAEEATRPTEWA